MVSLKKLDRSQSFKNSYMIPTTPFWRYFIIFWLVLVKSIYVVLQFYSYVVIQLLLCYINYKAHVCSATVRVAKICRQSQNLNSGSRDLSAS